MRGGLLLLPVVVSIPALLVMGATIADAVGRPDLGRGRKALWTVAVAVMPVIGVLIYLIARPFDDPGHGLAEGNERTAELLAVLDRQQGGELPPAEYAAAKLRIFGDVL